MDGYVEDRKRTLSARRSLLKKLDVFLIRLRDNRDCDEILGVGSAYPSFTMGDLRQAFECVQRAIEHDTTALAGVNARPHADA